MARLNRFGTRLDLFSRRTFLGGTGAALMIGLPLLETLQSRKAKAADAPAPPRLLCIGAGNGLPMDEFILTGLGIAEGRASPGDHGAGMPAIFSCAKPAPKATKLGITIDQLMANKYAAQTPRYPRGLQLAMAKGSTNGDGPYGATYLTNLSWRSATEPNPPSSNPEQAFKTMFAGIDPSKRSRQ